MSNDRRETSLTNKAVERLGFVSKKEVQRLQESATLAGAENIVRTLLGTDRHDVVSSLVTGLIDLSRTAHKLEEQGNQSAANNVKTYVEGFLGKCYKARIVFLGFDEMVEGTVVPFDPILHLTYDRVKPGEMVVFVEPGIRYMRRIVQQPLVAKSDPPVTPQ